MLMRRLCFPTLSNVSRVSTRHVASVTFVDVATNCCRVHRHATDVNLRVDVEVEAWKTLLSVPLEEIEKMDISHTVRLMSVYTYFERWWEGRHLGPSAEQIQHARVVDPQLLNFVPSVAKSEPQVTLERPRPSALDETFE